MDSNENIELIRRSDNMEKIIEMAKDDPDWQVRQFAVCRVEDDEVLKDIFMNDDVPAVRTAAMERIGDIDFLVDNCLNNPFSYIRLAILNRISDESLLEDNQFNSLLKQVILNDPDDFIAKAAIENRKLDNQEILIDIAKSKRDISLRCAAISRFTDEGILIDYALYGSDALIRRAAISNINLSNNNVLGIIIKRESDEFNRRGACEKITDESYLRDLIFDRSCYPFLDVFSGNYRMPSDDYFMDVYENDADEYRRQVAVKFIADASYLVDIVLNETNDKIRFEAIKNRNFTNRKIINDLLSSETDEEVLCVLISKVSFEEALIEYVKSNPDDGKATLEAISKISDVEFLDELSGSANPKIRQQTVKSISNKPDRSRFRHILKRIALTDENREIALESVKAMQNNKDLIDVASDCGDRQIRLAALENMKAGRLLDEFLFTSRGPVRNSLEDLFYDSKLNHLALDDDDGEIRKAAISKLTSKQILDRIISLDNEDSAFARERLNTLFEDIKRIDRKPLLEILISSEDSDVSFIAQQTRDDLSQWKDRIKMVNEIEDIDKLKDIAENDFNYYVRCEAEGKIENILFNIRLDEINSPNNQEKLKDIAMDNTFSAEIRRKALSKINDKSFLTDMGMSNEQFLQ